MDSDEKDRKPNEEQSENMPGGPDVETDGGIRQAAVDPQEIGERHEDDEPGEAA